MCKHYWLCLHDLTSKLRNCVAVLQCSALNMFLLSRTGCEQQRASLFQWPSSASILGWESQKSDKVLENCCGTGSVDVTFPAPLVQKVGAGHRLQARNILMLIYGSSRRRGIWLLHIGVFHLWAIILTQVWVDAKKKFKTTSFELQGKGLPTSMEMSHLWAELRSSC